MKCVRQQIYIKVIESFYIKPNNILFNIDFRDEVRCETWDKIWVIIREIRMWDMSKNY